MRAMKFAAPSLILALALTAGAQTTKPAATQPTATTKPATSKPTATRPATTRPVATTRATSRPATTQATSRPTSQPTSQPTTRVTIDHTSPKALLESAHNAVMAEDFDSMVLSMEPKYQPVMGRLMGVLKKVQVWRNSLTKVMVEKFGKEPAAKLLADGGPLGSDEKMTPFRSVMTPDGKILWEQIAIKEEGDKAEVSIRGDATVQVLKKIDGKWYASPVSEEMTPEDIEQGIAMAEKMAGVMEKLMTKMEEGIRSGEITPENFQEKTMQAMQAAFQGGDDAPTTAPTSKPSAGEDF